MGRIATNLSEDVTHWAVTASGFGGFTYTTPAALKGRWEEKSVLFRNPGGVEEVSQAIVYLDTDVAVEDYLFLGTSVAADPTLLADTWQVRQFHKIPDLRNLDHERKVFL